MHSLELDLDGYIECALLDARILGARKDLVVGRRGGNDGLRVRDEPEHLASSLTELLLDAVRHSPVRGIVTLDVLPHGTEVVITVYDQRPPAGRDRSLRYPKA